MRRPAFLAVIVLTALTALCCKGDKALFTITVDNPSALERVGEMVEVAQEALDGLPDLFVVMDDKGGQVPYQITYDGKIIFQADVPPNAKAVYTICDPVCDRVCDPVCDPGSFDTIVCGRQYPGRMDDIAWENDRIAFRTYGPALQASGERAFGYDLWVKNVLHPVVEDRYYQELTNGVSYHTDHGNGLDYYNVGPTLGAGTSALMSSDTLVYPYCYKTYEILDNGPLRFTVSLTYNPVRAGGDEGVVETRLLTLDAGSQMNKAVISFEGLSKVTPLAIGIVIHEAANDYLADTCFIACAGSIDPVNGQFYAGAVFPYTLKEAGAVYFTDNEKAERKAAGHVLAISDYAPGTKLTYYWGGGWSKWGFPASDDWFTYMRGFACKVKAPLIVSVQ
ncbi:MAG: DUF4861 domain-containing protein [Tannerellaceae bacterium]|jgi:hypothetical protein|nr:DUF4861 domain-containing protein [Tannerellaceae bacterium]